MTDRVKRPTNYINLGAWSCGKEGRMKEEEGEGSHIDKSMPKKLVHTVRGLFRRLDAGRIIHVVG